MSERHVGIIGRLKRLCAQPWHSPDGNNNGQPKSNSSIAALTISLTEWQVQTRASNKQHLALRMQSSDLGHAAIDDQLNTGDIATFVGSQK